MSGATGREARFRAAVRRSGLLAALALALLLGARAASAGEGPSPSPSPSPAGHEDAAAELRALNPALRLPAAAEVTENRDGTWTVRFAEGVLRDGETEFLSAQAGGPGEVRLDPKGRPITGLRRRAYFWVRAKAFAPSNWAWLAGLSFAESSFFPIPPDVMLIPLVIFSGTWGAALLFAAICLAASVLGGLLGYAIGRFGGRPLLDRFFSKEKINAVERAYQKYDVWAVAAGGFTPLPYKLFTISAGAFRLNVPRFILASLLSRGARFFLVAGLCAAIGPSIEKFLEANLAWLSILFFVGLLGGFYAVSVIARRSARKKEEPDAEEPPEAPAESEEEHA